MLTEWGVQALEWLDNYLTENEERKVSEESTK